MVSRSDMRSSVSWPKKVMSNALESPDTLMHLLKHMLRVGGSTRDCLEM